MGQTVLHREIGDGRFLLVFGRVHVGAELIIRVVQAFHELRVFRQLYHPVIADDVQQNDGVRVGAVPCLGVYVAEKVFRFAVPCPP